MKPLKPGIIPPSETENVIMSMQFQWMKGNAAVRAAVGESDRTAALARIRELVESEQRECVIWMNDTYQVAVREHEHVVHLSIKRTDRKPCHDWRDLQEIKNQIVGRECEGVELYPAESRLVDSANQFHLWCVKDPEYRFPFGFTGARVVTDEPIGKSVNRPLKQEPA